MSTVDDDRWRVEGQSGASVIGHLDEHSALTTTAYPGGTSQGPRPVAIPFRSEGVLEALQGRGIVCYLGNDPWARDRYPTEDRPPYDRH